jgi:hypothetical protein
MKIPVLIPLKLRQKDFIWLLAGLLLVLLFVWLASQKAEEKRSATPPKTQSMNRTGFTHSSTTSPDRLMRL